ncbi:MAG: O-antigen ligase family protein [Lachnospiraceae bacterium]|nr:O-antigen ligase family protein [Lachnospiraceae bacterium]
MKTKESKIHLLSLVLLFLALAVLPFIVRIYAYHLDMEEYSWFILDEDRTDFFSYYKSLFFLILALLMAADLIRALLRRHLSPGTSPVWALLLINGILFLLSAVCSVNVKDSLFGNYGRFESVFVLIGYEILCFYAFRYASDPRTFQILLRGLAAAAALMCLLGFLQAAGMDPLNLEWVQRLITPHELWDEVIGNISSNLTQNTVYLTLANPNYASIYLSMLLPLMFILWKTGSRTVRFCSGCLILLLFADLILTFSRVGLFSLGIIGILTLILRKNSRKRHWKKMLAAVFACTLLFFLTDSLSGFRFAERLKLTLQSFQKSDTPSLTYMETSAEGVTLTYGGRTITVSYQYGTGNESIRILDDDGTDLTDHYIAPAGILDLEGLENLLLFTREVDEEDMLTLIIDEVFWNFTEDPELGYLFYTGNGKYDTLSEIPRANLFGMEHMASGRLYIWSRTIPLLKDYWLTGSGEDTFYLVFPQNDYVGKAAYAGSPLDVIEKPHNTYLLTALQNGILSLILFLVFYLIYFIDSIRIYGKDRPFDTQDWMGFCVFLSTACFMTGGIFNDSNINISPLFWAMLGIGMGLNRHIRAERSQYSEQ